MAPRRRSPGEARIAFDALSIEGGLLGAEWLGKVAQLQAAAQEPADYRVPKGLHIRDEIARSWRIAQACFQEMEAGRASGGDARALAERFLEAFLRDALCFRVRDAGGAEDDRRAGVSRPVLRSRRSSSCRSSPGGSRPGYPPARARRRPAPAERLRTPAGDPERLRRGALGSRGGRAVATDRAGQREPHAASVDRSRHRQDLHGGPVPRLRPRSGSSPTSHASAAPTTHRRHVRWRRGGRPAGRRERGRGTS